jgi:hypothetical protein
LRIRIIAVFGMHFPPLLSLSLSSGTLECSE